MTDDRLIELWNMAMGSTLTLSSRALAFARAVLAESNPVATLEWRPIESAPRDGSNILIRFGQDGVSQAKYVAGYPFPWKFIDTNDGITWLVNHAVDTKYGPTHWMPMPGHTRGAA